MRSRPVGSAVAPQGGGRRRAVADANGQRRRAASEEGEVIAECVKKLATRWFVTRGAGEGNALVNVRAALSWLRGPMTRAEVAKLTRRLSP